MIYGILYTFTAILSRIVNRVIFRGDIHQSLSARAWIDGRTDQVWRRRQEFIDRLVFWEPDHCALSWDDEVFRANNTLALDHATRGDFSEARRHLGALDGHVTRQERLRGDDMRNQHEIDPRF